jgi:superkiller protein 3
LEFASRTFSGLKNARDNRSASSDSLFPAFFVLDRYCRRRPNDAVALQLSGLICERIGQLEYGIEQTRRAIFILEAAYEDTEDPQTERQFTFATSNLARMLLSVQDYQGALESFESALGLLSEDEDPIAKRLRIQGQFGSGLANFKLGNLDAALDMLEAAFESAHDDLEIKGQVTVLLAQTMWAIGTKDFQEMAKARLLQRYSTYNLRVHSDGILTTAFSIAADPGNLAAITALAGMGILTEDDSLIDAALSEILSLPLDRRRQLDPRRDVDYLLIQHHLGQVS